ncbi:conserved hypothetical protein [Candidatus Glomeribacter gigasporarum BEG34]|uniref:Uncharacterized protein n=1 Tax=Candidatus Glomeribacter gigasporarum BEG34 TaxID=1070319 RepID=G2JAY0_9BURK|nr:hypothetical protein [Candidatus Glomeribacter gigasporarum]CCD29932.1 conserved hypothetical protein [Candidatus Glomeribacter gigasporarum BEG34]
MPINGLSVGRDITLDLITPNGPLRLNVITKFTSKPDVVDEKIKPLNRAPIHLRFPDGWSGSFEIERDSDALDRHFARAEDDYYLGVNESPCTITETIIEPNDAISQYRYEGVLLKLEDAGEWEDTKSVKQKLSFVASRRKKVS